MPIKEWQKKNSSPSMPLCTVSRNNAIASANRGAALRKELYFHTLNETMNERVFPR